MRGDVNVVAEINEAIFQAAVSANQFRRNDL
jgi:hypothetical protein